MSRATAARATKQGVPDLNGPRMNGSGYNGNKSASCAHHRAPDLTPTHKTSRVVSDDGSIERMRTAYFTCCSLCGIELYETE